MPKIKEQSGYVFKRPGSPYYYARWWVGGKEYVQTTKKKTKPEAETEKDLPWASSRRLLPSKFRGFAKPRINSQTRGYDR
jgi:hypothetical protein